MSNPAASAGAPPIRRGRVRLGNALLNGLVFLAVLAGGGWLLRSVWSFPEAQGVHPKFTYFAENKGRFDTLFIGSSRFFHQIIPRQFDAATSAGGVQTNSFNCAYDGVWPPESYYFLRRILDLRPPHLRWVVIDLMDINSRLEERSKSTLRAAYWHDWQHTRMALRDVFGSNAKAGEKLDLTLVHTRLFLQTAMNLGRGSDVLQQRISPPKKKQQPPSWIDDAGFEAGPERQLTGGALISYLEAVAELKAKLPPWAVRPLFREALHELIVDVRAAGAEPIFVIAPTINPRENFTGVPDGATVFAFNDPVQYPNLFEPDRHYDAWHLRRKGAVEFTDLLAAKFTARAKAQ